MCIIVVQPKGHSFSDAEITDFYNHNPHGFGVMYVEDGELKGARGVPSDAEEAVRWYREYGDKRACVLHYRYATSGLIDATMAHPFPVSDELMVVHNGVLPGGNELESDTFQFVRDTLKPLFGAKGGYKRLHDPEVRAYLEKIVKGSAVVFLDVEGEVHKFGNKGLEYNGCWYSNTYAWSPPWVKKHDWPGRGRRSGRPPEASKRESSRESSREEKHWRDVDEWARWGRDDEREAKLLEDEDEDDAAYTRWLAGQGFKEDENGDLVEIDFDEIDLDEVDFDEKTEPDRDRPWWDEEEFFKPKGKGKK